MSSNKEPYINTSDGKEIVKLITDIGRKNGAKIWIHFGTLLGHTRDNGFIPHDRDIDFGIEYKYWNDNIISDLKKFGFKIWVIIKFTESHFFKFVGVVKKNIIGKIRFQYKNINICLDVFHEGVDNYKDYMYSCQPKIKNYLIELPKNLLIPQTKATFYDIDIWIPENYMGFIEYAYGKSWQNPIEDYIGSKTHKKNSDRFKRRVVI
jgi:phosphorylcholine metabolism protein LicD